MKYLFLYCAFHFFLRNPELLDLYKSWPISFFPGTAYDRGRYTFSIKGQIINILGFVGRVVSMVTAQFLHGSGEAATEHG